LGIILRTDTKHPHNIKFVSSGAPNKNPTPLAIMELKTSNLR
jgi:hypothetical protein